MKAADRVTRVAARQDEGLADADSGLAGVEERVAGAIYIDVWGHSVASVHFAFRDPTLMTTHEPAATTDRSSASAASFGNVASRYA